MQTQKYNAKFKSNLILFSLLSVLAISQFAQNAFADIVSDPNYSIDVNTIDTNPQPTHAIIKRVLGIENKKSDFTTGPNYTVTTSNDSFAMQLSQNSVDFGILSSINPVIRTSTITFSTPQLGAEILTYENHPFLITINSIIQNTTCDNGACSPTTAALWNNTLTYGFGYRCESTQTNLCDTQFKTSNYFKQYPDDSKNQLPAALMISHGNKITAKGSVTDKVNIAGTQKTGGYYNSITYLAIPNF